MTYQVLARKWRPQDFSSVVGQEPVVTALRNSLAGDRVAQAYLFSGIRGVGKTSVARILAKALNCENGPAADPCNRCNTCAEITAGSDLDVIEVDAATYSKVEQVRELTESLKYGPARDRYKVVIIDEIHRLSRQAFDALLKIVEEPPPHLVFVFATTEAEAVPATILSRCQEHRFRRVPAQELTDHLAAIARDEKIEVSDAALRLITRAGDGSVRDAVALLDQLATYGSGSIPDEEAARLLGGVDHALFHRLLSAIVGGGAAAVREIVAAVEEEGWDPRHVFTEFLAYCRDALHLALGAEAVDLPGDEARELASLATAAGYENLLRLLGQLLASESVVRHSESGSLALEIAWLRAAELPKLVRIEEVLGGAAGSPSGGGIASRPGKAHSGEPAAAPARSAAPEKPRRPAPARTAEPPRAARPAPAPSPEPPLAADDELDAEDGSALPGPEPEHVRADFDPGEEPARGPYLSMTSEPEPSPQPDREDADEAASPADPAVASVEQFLNEVSKRREALAAHLRAADRLEFAAGLLSIHAPHEDPLLNQERLQRPANRRILDEALVAVWGEGARWKLVHGAPAEPVEQEAPPAALEEVLSDPRVQTVLDIFGGSVESVVENERLGER